MIDHYEVLGVSAGASEAVIRTAYRARTRQSHPHAGGRAGAAQRVDEAYAVLSDPDQRVRYDRARAGSPASTAPATAMNEPAPASLALRP